MAKKRKRKRNNAPGGRIEDGSVKPLVLFASALFASACFVYAVESLIGKSAFVNYLLALASGILTGFSGNPLWPSLLPEFISGIFPDALRQTGFFSGINPLYLFAFAAASMSAASIFDGIKYKRMRYEPAILIPALGVPAMIVAAGFRSDSESSLKVLSSFFNDYYLSLFLISTVLILVGIKWALKTEHIRDRHRLFSVIAGPLAGIWIGYMREFWMFSLIALLYFFYLMVLNENTSGALSGIPAAAVAFIFVKLFFFKEAASGSASGINITSNIVLLIVLSAGFMIAHIFSSRLMAALSSKTRNTIFFSTVVLSMILSLYHLIISRSH
jgi:hypothetical protein